MLDRTKSPEKSWGAAPRTYSNSRNTLVLGGAGFVGSHLCERLLAEGHTVTCVDNMLTGSPANVAHLMQTNRFSLVQHDIVKPMKFTGRFDQIYNLACPASPPAYQADPIHTMKTSVLGAINVLDLAREDKASVFQASTSEIYGDPLHHPQNEKDWGNVNPIGPRACYDEGKRCAETLFFDYHRVHGVKIRVARIFNTYGPRMAINDGRVVSNFVVAALQNKPITIYGTGAQTRSFCYVDDLVTGIIRMMNAPDNVVGPINLGNPEEFTVRDFAELVIRLTNSKSSIVYLPLPTDDPRQRRPDIGRAAEILGWRPTVAVEAGVLRTIAYFDSVLRIPEAVH
ncbi:UDP-glucuronic acid decarboxylase family protein [Aestuariivirga sp. YIM B02566]|uniref:SDR family oxidoreductase n=1 Tax=Taklimakanibacter albus TaxID=2800327 RepID=A0ACC5R3G2_9HYPH|nr:UDP-glucuronic acid decarboxylase family protein [Aestuariivirga sp. YIM B02566]MBK1867142.1 SDR family oxidoreductase [Aestuariivirga sp. YIM B02566]